MCASHSTLELERIIAFAVIEGMNLQEAKSPGGWVPLPDAIHDLTTVTGSFNFLKVAEHIMKKLILLKAITPRMDS